MSNTTSFRQLAAILALIGAVHTTGAAAAPKNLVQIDAVLTTSAQPAPAYFDTLAQEGYGMVINLAPPESQGSLPDEGALVGGNGMIYVNIPVDWHKPTTDDFDFFSAALNAANGRRTLVHCQLNMRASSFVFLYRVVRNEVAPEDAAEALNAVWVPDETWTTFIEETLAAHGIDFEL